MEVWRFLRSLSQSNSPTKNSGSTVFTFTIYFLKNFGFKVIVMVLNPVQWPPSYQDKSSALSFAGVWCCGLASKCVLKGHRVMGKHENTSTQHL